MVTFFCYCAVEQTAGLWAGSYLVLQKGVTAETEAGFTGLFFIGITVGRALSGFLTMKLSDSRMIRLGQGIIVMGIACLLPPLFGLIANHITVSLFPFYLLAILALMVLTHEMLLKKSGVPIKDQ